MRDDLWTKGLVVGIIILFIGANNITNINGSIIENNNTEIINYIEKECLEPSKNNNVVWFENFDDGSINDWEITNPLDNLTKKINLSITTEKAFSSPYSLWISSRSYNWYGATAKGPDLNIDLTTPYSIEFYFYYTEFHMYNLVKFGHVNIHLDKKFLGIRCENDTGRYNIEPAIQDCCPPNKWNLFKIDVDPYTNSYSIYINGNRTVSDFKYGSYDSNMRGFYFRDLTGAPAEPDYIENGYYDNIKISHQIEAGFFYDNFDDRVRSFDKWTEKYTNGSYVEDNQRADFRIWGSAKIRYEGIESVPIRVNLAKNETLLVTWDLFTKLGSTSEKGIIKFKVKDSNGNWIEVCYDRENNLEYCNDSSKTQDISIGYNIEDGNWSNLLQIFDNKYFVMMGNHYKWVLDSPISPSDIIDIQLEIYLMSGEKNGGLFSLTGFDNIKIRNKSIEWSRPPTQPTITKVDKDWFEFSSVEPDGNTFYYYVDWGDEKVNNKSTVIEGGNLDLQHIYDSKGLYEIKAKAIDTSESASESAISTFYIYYNKSSIYVLVAESPWSDPLPITMPYSYKPIPQFLELFFQRFPHAFPILRQLLGY